MKGKIKIVNGEVVRDGADLEAGSQRGATTSSGSTSVGQAANSLSSNSFVNNVSRYNKGAIAFLVVLALLGMRIAFPILMMVVLYNVFKSSSSATSPSLPFSPSFGRTGSSALRSTNARRTGGNVRTVSDLPKPPPSA